MSGNEDFSRLIAMQAEQFAAMMGAVARLETSVSSTMQSMSLLQRDTFEMKVKDQASCDVDKIVTERTDTTLKAMCQFHEELDATISVIKTALDNNSRALTEVHSNYLALQEIKEKGLFVVKILVVLLLVNILCTLTTDIPTLIEWVKPLIHLVF